MCIRDRKNGVDLPLMRRHTINFFSVKNDRTLIRLQKAADDPQRGRFSTAGWAQQRDKLLVANIKIQVFQNRLAVKGYGDIF